MFGKNKKKKENVMLNTTPTVEPAKDSVIAQDVIFEGNITTTGPIYIYGQVKGNIHVKDGQITIMREGLVTGNVTSPVLIVDGHLEGECSAGSVEIRENGRIEGGLRYATLSVARGGILVGQTEHCAAERDNNVIDLTHEKNENKMTVSG